MQAATITPATAADAPVLAALINQAYRGPATPQSWTTEAHLLAGARISEAQVAAMLQSADATQAAVFKYLDANAVLVGCVYVQPQGPQLYLSTLAVAPSAQAQGIGRQLLTQAEAYARQHGCTSITISVLDARPELLAWYERHGYQRTGQNEPFPDTIEFGRPRQPLALLGLAKPVPAAA